MSSGTQADLRVTNSASPNPVTAGNNITYTQSVINAGQATANAPVFTETLPAGTSCCIVDRPCGVDLRSGDSDLHRCSGDGGQYDSEFHLCGERRFQRGLGNNAVPDRFSFVDYDRSEQRATTA